MAGTGGTRGSSGSMPHLPWHHPTWHQPLEDFLELSSPARATHYDLGPLVMDWAYLGGYLHTKLPLAESSEL